MEKEMEVEKRDDNVVEDEDEHEKENEHEHALPELTEAQLLLDEEPCTMLKYFHLKDIDGGKFSRKKKQHDLWEFTWGSSVLLAPILYKWLRKFQSTNADTPNCKINVFELGAGMGLPSLAIAKAEVVHEITVSDLVDDAVRVVAKSASKFLSDNARRTLNFQALSWNTTSNFPEGSQDFIVGSDILFGRWCVNPVVNVIWHMLRPGGFCILTDPCRLNDGDFMNAIEEKGANPLIMKNFPSSSVGETSQVASASTSHDSIVNVNRAKMIIARKPWADQLKPGTPSQKVQETQEDQEIQGVPETQEEQARRGQLDRLFQAFLDICNEQGLL